MGYEAIYEDLQACADVALGMRRRGVRVDGTALAAHDAKLRHSMSAARRAYAKLVPARAFPCGEFGNNGALRKLFFEELRCGVLAHSELTGKPTLDAWTLQQYALGHGVIGTPGHLKYVRTLAEVLLRLRKAAKMHGTYVKGLPLLNGHVHPIWKVHGAITGRWACARPNLQNVPKRGTNMRTIFVPRRAGDLFVGADYDKLELRIVAILSNDTPLLDAFARNIDVHQANACDIFQTPKPTKEQRDFAKRFVYGLNYGAEAQTVYDALVVEFPKLTLSLVSALRTQWFRKHPAIRLWHTQTMRRARETCRVEVPVEGGRFEEFHDGAVEFNKVVNFPVQGLGGFLANRAIRMVDEACRADPSLGNITFQVHDELTGEGPDVKRLGAVIKQAMEAPVRIGDAEWVFPVDLKYGPNWGEMEKLKL